jgi:hypothetical protein
VTEGLYFISLKQMYTLNALEFTIVWDNDWIMTTHSSLSHQQLQLVLYQLMVGQSDGWSMFPLLSRVNGLQDQNSKMPVQ